MTKRVRTTRRLEVWLKDTSVALFVLNSQRRLVFFNAGCERLTGWTPTDVMGRICNYVTEADSATSEALLASLAPPANVWQGDTVVVPAFIARREYQPLETTVHFFPLTDGTQKVQAALGIIQPATIASANGPATTSQRLHNELVALRQSLHQRFGDGALISRSLAMQRVLDRWRLAEQSELPVLFVGEPGTGRESLARMIHEASAPNESSFVPLDCRKLLADHLEETLHRLRNSLQSNAFRPGTIYLNHVDWLPRDLQQVVLELIQSKGPKLRVMAASLGPLDPVVESGTFRQDLFYSITSIVIEVPPLRERQEDLEPLAQYFLEESNRGEGPQVTGFHDEVLRQFRRYNWPGNVAELRAVVLDARNACTGFQIETEHLPFRFRAGVSGQSVGPAAQQRSESLDLLLLRIEREQIEQALVEARFNKAKAAELLGINRPRLYRRMEVLEIVDRDSADENSGTD
jgi:DNA-binding NtrC family response regulator